MLIIQLNKCILNHGADAFTIGTVLLKYGTVILKNYTVISCNGTNILQRVTLKCGTNIKKHDVEVYKKVHNI